MNCSKLRLSTPDFAKGFGLTRLFLTMEFFYVNILQLKKIPDKFYIGFTEDLESRLKSHNQGNNPHTAKYKPWRVKTAIAFTNRQRALDFEKYLKSPSGRAFAKKRL
jgi:putative endonuclease